MSSAYLISGVRTPIGSFLGGFASLSATDLGGVAIENAILKSGLSNDRIDEVIMGNVIGAGVGQAPARQAALKAGLPQTLLTVTAAIVVGRPALSAAWRAGAWPTPAPITFPIITSSIRSLDNPDFRIAFSIATPPRSVAERLANPPRKEPIGVRTPEMR